MKAETIVLTAFTANLSQAEQGVRIELAPEVLDPAIEAMLAGANIQRALKVVKHPITLPNGEEIWLTCSLGPDDAMSVGIGDQQGHLLSVHGSRELTIIFTSRYGVDCQVMLDPGYPPPRPVILSVSEGSGRSRQLAVTLLQAREALIYARIGGCL